MFIAVRHEYRYTNGSQIGGEISFREGSDALLGRVQTNLHTLQPELAALSVADRHTVIGAVECFTEILVELGPVTLHPGAIQQQDK